MCCTPDSKFGSPQQAALAHHVGVEPGDRRELRAADTMEGSAGPSASSPYLASHNRGVGGAEGHLTSHLCCRTHPGKSHPSPTEEDGDNESSQRRNARVTLSLQAVSWYVHFLYGGCMVPAT